MAQLLLFFPSHHISFIFPITPFLTWQGGSPPPRCVEHLIFSCKEGLLHLKIVNILYYINLYIWNPPNLHLGCGFLAGASEFTHTIPALPIPGYSHGFTNLWRALMMRVYYKVCLHVFVLFHILMMLLNWQGGFYPSWPLQKWCLVQQEVVKPSLSCCYACKHCVVSYPCQWVVETCHL